MSSDRCSISNLLPRASLFIPLFGSLGRLSFFSFASLSGKECVFCLFAPTRKSSAKCTHFGSVELTFLFRLLRSGLCFLCVIKSGLLQVCSLLNLVVEAIKCLRQLLESLLRTGMGYFVRVTFECDSSVSVEFMQADREINQFLENISIVLLQYIMHRTERRPHLLRTSLGAAFFRGNPSRSKKLVEVNTRSTSTAPGIAL